MPLARWIHFCALFVLFGSSAFWLHMGDAVWDGTASRGPGAIRATRRIDRIAGPVAALSGCAWLIGSIANMTGEIGDVLDPQTLHAFFLESSFGVLAIVRLGLLIALTATALMIGDTRRRAAGVTIASGLLLISQAWLGHAAEDGGTVYGASMIASYVVHVLAGAAWLGGLVPLFAALVEARGNAPTIGVTRLLARYSTMATIAVALILLSGIANSAFRLGAVSGNDLASRYGIVLGAKLALIASLLVLAGANRFLLMPRMARASRRTLHAAMIASVAAEAILGALVLGVAAILGITPPPR